MPRYCPRCGETLHSHGTTTGEVRKTARRAYVEKPSAKKKTRKKTARGRAYAAAFKKVQGKYKKKSGGWQKDGFKKAAAAARRMIK